MSAAPQRRPRRSSKIATAAEYAALSFEGVRADEPEGGRSEADWIEAAKHEFFLFQSRNFPRENDVRCGGCPEDRSKTCLALFYGPAELAKKCWAGPRF